MKQIHPVMADNFKKINCPFYYFGECTERAKRCDPRLCPPKKNALKIKEDNHEKEIRQAYYPPGHLCKMQQRANNSNRERQSTSSLL